MLFVSAMQVLSMPNVKISEIRLCHAKIIDFCKGFEVLYGKSSLYSNMHYHVHLLEQMLDFGSFHSHHAFNYERYNADLKGVNTNNKSIERTVVNKFVENVHRQDYFSSSTIPDLGSHVSFDNLKSIFLDEDIHGKKKAYENDFLSLEIENANDAEFDLFGFIDLAGNSNGNGEYTHAYGFEQPPCSTVKSMKFNKDYSVLSSDEYDQLLCYYQEFFDLVFCTQTTHTKKNFSC